MIYKMHSFLQKRFLCEKGAFKANEKEVMIQIALTSLLQRNRYLFTKFPSTTCCLSNTYLGTIVWKRPLTGTRPLSSKTMPTDSKPRLFVYGLRPTLTSTTSAVTSSLALPSFFSNETVTESPDRDAPVTL